MNQTKVFFILPILGVIKEQEKSIQLYPNCPWEIPLDHDITVGEYRITKLEAFQPSFRNKTQISVKIHITRFIWGKITTAYLPTIFLLIIVHLTFYFPEDNFQVRITISLSCMMILTFLFGTVER